MKNPRQIETVVPGAIFIVPTYRMSDAGILDSKSVELKFCKGSKDDPTINRQEGFFTETLIQACKMFLEDVNSGKLASRDTSMAITKLDEALMWLKKRSDDRVLREVKDTYHK
jgi:hypothetical protein